MWAQASLPPPLEDAQKVIQQYVFDLAGAGDSAELQLVLEEHPGMDVDQKLDDNWRALFNSCTNGHAECTRLLLEHKADVHLKNGYMGVDAMLGALNGGDLGCVQLLVQYGAPVHCPPESGWPPLLNASKRGHLGICQFLIEQKADINYRWSHHIRHGNNEDALFLSMQGLVYQWHFLFGAPFAFLSCNTDVKNMPCDDRSVNRDICAKHVKTYSQVQNYIEKYHRILQPVLSEHVPVDRRIGLGQMGIYQEPLERTLEYLGLSMTKNQVVNTSIDGPKRRRVLIPGHLLNAKHWFDKHTMHLMDLKAKRSERAKIKYREKKKSLSGPSK
jgi:hypothetical protein